MSGHSKWTQIKRQKGAADKKRGQIFSKLSRAITLAAKQGGDQETNFKLRLEISRAKDHGMPADNIDRAIKRGAGEDKTTNLENIVYEAYGPGGVAILIETATDNRNRTTNNIRHILSKHQGSLGSQGSVSYLFNPTGQILIIKNKKQDLEEISLLAIDLGAKDVRTSTEGLEIYTSPTDLQKIKDELEKHGVPIVSYELIMQPQIIIDFNEAVKNQLIKLLELLEDDDDVVAVHTNSNI